MTDYGVQRLALVLAVQAEVEGMKAENLIREQQNLSPAYGRDNFEEMSGRLTNLAYSNDDQL